MAKRKKTTKKWVLIGYSPDIYSYQNVKRWLRKNNVKFEAYPKDLAVVVFNKLSKVEDYFRKSKSINLFILTELENFLRKKERRYLSKTYGNDWLC